MCFDLNINGVSCLEFYSFHFEIKIKKKIVYQNSNVVFGCHSTSLSAHFYFSLWQRTAVGVAAEVFGAMVCLRCVCVLHFLSRAWQFYFFTYQIDGGTINWSKTNTRSDTICARPIQQWMDEHNTHSISSILNAALCNSQLYNCSTNVGISFVSFVTLTPPLLNGTQV